ncbi:MAG: hypothetical protein HYZ34_12540 [Ignavibacteriae bacterium]|nr:hypothetical protein [Ignavibacteriota bacterium]
MRFEIERMKDSRRWGLVKKQQIRLSINNPLSDYQVSEAHSVRPLG